MSKRKLSKRQSHRIQQNRQADSLTRGSKSSEDLGELENGLVISRFGNQADVEAGSGQIQRCMFRKHMGSPVAGDNVMWRLGSEQGVIESVLPRTSELTRPDSYGNLKPVAANVDCMVISVAIRPEPHLNLIDRYLVAASNLNIQAIIAINKCDLINEENQHLIDEIQSCYTSLDIPSLKISAKKNIGLEELRAQLRGKISVFVGQSGVGKSSILQALMPNEQIKIGEISEQTAKGKHTTTNAKLYHFPSGGDCIDSPGIREFGLWHLSPQEVMQGFPDLEHFANQCKFRDCSHTKEPGCAILKALKDKQIDSRRLESYRRIIHSLEEVKIKTKNRDLL